MKLAALASLRSTTATLAARFADRWTHRPQGAMHPLAAIALFAAIFGACVILGLMAATTATMFAARPMVLVALPASMLLVAAVLLNRHAVLLAILVFRAALDPVLDQTKIPLMGSALGLGAVLNLLIIGLALSYLRSLKDFKYMDGAKYFIPFMLISAISVLYSPEPVDAVKAFMQLVTYSCAFLLGGAFAVQRGVFFVLRMIVVSSLVPTLLAVIMLVTGWKMGVVFDSSEMVGSEAGRFSGPFTHPNIFAFYILLVAASSLLLLHLAEMKPITRLAMWSYLALMLVFLLQTKTRSAWAAFGVMLGLYAVFYNRKLIFPLIFLFVVAALLPEVRSRLTELGDDRGYLVYSLLNSYEWRKMIWTEGLAWLPVVNYAMGKGAGAFFYHSSEFFSLSGGRKYGAHSVYVQTMFDQGIVGIVAFLIMLLGPIQRFFRCVRSDQGVFAFFGLLLMLAYMLVCYSDNVMRYLVYNIYSWFLVGAIFFHVAGHQVEQVPASSAVS